MNKQSPEKQPKALVLDGYGLNCGYETKKAFELAGAEAERVHINELKSGKKKMEDYHVMAFIGGFSRGDHHGAGVIEARNFRDNLEDELMNFIEDEKLIIGICNGFQILANLGILPGIDRDYQSREVALEPNDCGNFQDRWVRTKANDSKSIFTKGIDELRVPIRHAEGKFYAEEDVMNKLFEENQVALQYAAPEGKLAKQNFPHNPNGSLRDIAGITDSTGRIFGLMPHPEAALYFTNLPDWTKKAEGLRREGKEVPEKGPGRKIFENAVEHIENNLI